MFSNGNICSIDLSVTLRGTSEQEILLALLTSRDLSCSSRTIFVG